MTEQNDHERAVWSRPSGSGRGATDYVVVPPATAGAASSTGSRPIVRPGHPDHPGAPSGLITERQDATASDGSPRGAFRSRDPVALGAGTRRPRTLRLSWFLGAAGALLAVGLVVVLVLSARGSLGSGHKLPFGVGKTEQGGGPPLAQACPPPTATANPGYREGPPPPPGPRTTDPKAGISYKHYGAPWNPWSDDWLAGQLHVHYRVGQAFVTETYHGGRQYMASILSGSVPATVNDGTILDLKCVGQQIVSDVRGAYYPQPNHMDSIEAKQTTLGGLHAWVSIFRLHFDDRAEGLKATSELVGVVTIDVGRPTAAVLYVSIPGTHKRYDWVVRDVISSVRATR